MLRHERMSVAMALAESTHHSAQSQKTARAGGEARVVLHGRVPDAPLPQGSRPPCLGEPRGPLYQDQLRTMEQAAAYAPMVQILDSPVPQKLEQLLDVLRFLDTLLPVPEQVIEVPKILLDDVPADKGAARRHSSSSSWRATPWSSRFSSQTQFNSDAFLQETHF